MNVARLIARLGAPRGSSVRCGRSCGLFAILLSMTVFSPALSAYCTWSSSSASVSYPADVSSYYVYPGLNGTNAQLELWPSYDLVGPNGGCIFTTVSSASWIVITANTATQNFTCPYVGCVATPGAVLRVAWAVSSNPSPQPRTATITITGAETPFTIFINQAGCTGSTCGGCPNVSVFPSPGAPYSDDGYPTSMTASFEPAANGLPISLTAAASACSVAGFDWQQTIEYYPPPSDQSLCNLAYYSSASPVRCLASWSAPTTFLTAPPELFDPGPGGGYTFEGFYDASFPYYYSPAEVSVGCAEFDNNGNCVLHITSNNGNTLNFFDNPATPLLPSGQFVAFKTRLVGIRPEGPSDLVLQEWTWTSKFNGCLSPLEMGCNASTGGVQTKSSSPVNGASGTGGVTITSINGVARTPPQVTCTATPNVLWPPNGMSVSVTVSGSITAGTSALTATTYAVRDEYGQVQPSGNITLGAKGSYSFSVPLIAARNGDDQNGRKYTINVSARDTINNVGSCSVLVTVPHDQGK